VTIARILAVLVVLGFPGAFAPVLVRAAARIPKRSRRPLVTMTCLIPLAATWLLPGDTSPLVVWLVTIAGGIVMIKTIDWLARPRRSDDLARVYLTLTVWPALQIEDVAVPLSGLKNRVET
jgi:hypothetical protein